MIKPKSNDPEATQPVFIPGEPRPKLPPLPRGHSDRWLFTIGWTSMCWTLTLVFLSLAWIAAPDLMGAVFGIGLASAFFGAGAYILATRWRQERSR